MLIATEPLFDLVGYMQVLLWIVLPVLLLGVLVAAFFHYRRKGKREKSGVDSFETILPLVPEKAQETYILFDHSGLLRQYKNKLSYSHARYAALKQDFDRLESKHARVTSSFYTDFITPKSNNMENMTDQLQVTINRITEEYAAEKKELLERLEQINRFYKSLESENESLLERIGMQTASDDEKGILVNHWKEENEILKNQLQEQEYIKDILEEKKAQIDFLQNQLEQRIRNHHQTENEKEEIKKDLAKMKNTLDTNVTELDSLKNEAWRKQESFDKLQVVIVQKEEQLTEKQQIINAKEDHITYVDNMLRELKQQNEILHAAVADEKDRYTTIQEQLLDEKLRATMLEQKLSSNKQLLQRLYKEFSACMEEDSAASPVVLLRPSYIEKVEEWSNVSV